MDVYKRRINGNIFVSNETEKAADACVKINTHRLTIGISANWA